LGQGLQPQLGSRPLRRRQLEVGDQHQRMHRIEAAHLGAAPACALGVGAVQLPVGDQRRQHRLQRQAAARQPGRGAQRRWGAEIVQGGFATWLRAERDGLAAILARPQTRPFPMTGPTFQDMIQRLDAYWAKQGCVLIQPLDLEVGAGTFHPATFLRALGPEPWNAAYVQPSRRPTDGRYGENPNRLQHYYQYQVAMKPNPDNIVEL